MEPIKYTLQALKNWLLGHKEDYFIDSFWSVEKPENDKQDIGEKEKSKMISCVYFNRLHFTFPNTMKCAVNPVSECLSCQQWKEKSDEV